MYTSTNAWFATRAVPPILKDAAVIVPVPALILLLFVFMLLTDIEGFPVRPPALVALVAFVAVVAVVALPLKFPLKVAAVIVPELLILAIIQSLLFLNYAMRAL